ncbi:DUF6541 family protein [Corynebacterium sp. NPDC060344]|uniref:DUF6541 family protein n=1 Tax=Corynebacterium sp. NPDC060344 TaxID=3347101 RepID=UPI00364BC5BF
MPWSEQLAAIVLVAAVIVVPGGVISLVSAVAGGRRPLLRDDDPSSPARGLSRVGAALSGSVAVTFGVAGTLTVVFDAWGLRWTQGSAAVAFAIVAVLAGLVAAGLKAVGGARGRRKAEAVTEAEPEAPASAATRVSEVEGAETERRAPRFAGRAWPWPLVWVIGALGSWSIVDAIGGLGTVVPGWDAFFHGSAMRWIAETGGACPTCMVPISEPAAAEHYYPTAYHAVGALAFLLDGGLMPATYTAMIALTALIFVLGAAALAVEYGARGAAVVVAAVVALMLPWFPWMLVHYGQLGPLGMAVAALPGAVALASAAVRDPSPGAVVPVGFALVGVAALHPSVGLAALAVVGVLGAATLVGRVAGALRRRAVGVRDDDPSAPSARPASLVWPVLGGALAAGVLLWIIDFGASDDLSRTTWPAREDFWTAAGNLGLLRDTPTAVQWVVLALAAAGIVAAVSGRPGLRRAVPAILVGAVAVWLATAARGSDAEWADEITRLWWNDWRRLAAIGVMGWAVAAAAGAEWLMRRARAAGGRRRAIVGAVLVVVVAFVAVASNPTRSELAGRYYGDVDGAVTEAELEAYDWLAKRYDGGVVLNDSFDGSSWLYTLHGVPVMFHVPLTGRANATHGPDRMLLNRVAHDAGMPYSTWGDEAARAIEKLDVRWVISAETWVGGHDSIPGGFLKLDQSPAFDEVYDRGGVTIYEVDRALIRSIHDID